MSNDGVDAGLSVAMHMRTPASRMAATGATPHPSIAFDRGQCATTTPLSARSRDLLVVDVHAMRGEEAGPEQAVLRECANAAAAERRRKLGGDRAPRALCRTSSHCSSSALSFKWVATGMSSSMQAA